MVLGGGVELTVVTTLFRVIKQLEDTCNGMRIHKDKGRELQERVGIIGEHVRTMQEPPEGPRRNALRRLRGRLEDAVKVVQKCSGSTLSRAYNHQNLLTELDGVNTGIDRAITDFHLIFFTSSSSSTDHSNHVDVVNRNHVIPPPVAYTHPKVPAYSLEDRANAGDSEAQNALGEQYMNSGGGLQDFKSAVVWFRKAVSCGQANAQAHYNLGKCYKNGKGVYKKPSHAKKHFKAAAKLGHEEAQEDLKQIQSFGSKFTQVMTSPSAAQLAYRGIGRAVGK